MATLPASQLDKQPQSHGSPFCSDPECPYCKELRREQELISAGQPLPAKKLIEVSDKTRDAKSKLLLADLSIRLAEIEMQFAEMMNENTQLRAKICVLENARG